MGFLGPTAGVNLPPEALRAAQILPTARYFAFAYPITAVGASSVNAAQLLDRFSDADDQVEG